MSDLVATKSQGKLIPEGVHQAVCFAIYDLGTQYSKMFDTEAHKVLIQWEVPDARIEVNGVDLPMAISKQYTLSLNEKANLKKDLDSWLGKTNEKSVGLKQLLKKNCQLLISHVDKDGMTYANITAIMALPKGVQPLEPENPVRFYSLEDGDNFPEGTPDWIIRVIKESKEYKMQRFNETDELPPQVQETLKKEGIKQIKMAKKTKKTEVPFD
jgi:hypothetical protein